jgi:hypothetical protein
VHPDQYVLERRHLVEEPDVLERAPDAELDDRMRRLADDLRPVEDDRTRRGSVDARDLVEERRLTRAVGTDQRDDRAPRNREVDVVGRDEAAELLPDVFGDEEVVGLALDQSPPLRSLSAPSCCTS